MGGGGGGGGGGSRCYGWLEVCEVRVRFVGFVRFAVFVRIWELGILGLRLVGLGGYDLLLVSRAYIPL